MTQKLKATQGAFDDLAEIMSCVPHTEPGSTLEEIYARILVPIGIASLSGILSTQVSRGWLVVGGEVLERRYRRVFVHVRPWLADRIDII